MALGCPVNENGPDPGFPTCPVISDKFNKAVFLSVPTTLWLSPMAHMLINPFESPIISAAFRISDSETPHIFEASFKDVAKI